MPSLPETPSDLINFLKSTKCTVIKFSASWCGPCKNKDFLQNYHILQNIYAEDSNVIFFQYDIDEYEELVSEKKLYDFNITAVPTIKIFNFDKLMNEYKGIPNMENIKNDINTVLKF